MSRRGFVRSTALSAATLTAATLPAASRLGPAHAAGGAGATGAAVAPAPGGLYAPNAAPLLPTAFLRLPPGSVKAAGWLDGQLRLQLAGLGVSGMSTADSANVVQFTDSGTADHLCLLI